MGVPHKKIQHSFWFNYYNEAALNLHHPCLHNGTDTYKIGLIDERPINLAWADSAFHLRHTSVIQMLRFQIPPMKSLYPCFASQRVWEYTAGI